MNAVHEKKQSEKNRRLLYVLMSVLAFLYSLAVITILVKN